MNLIRALRWLVVLAAGLLPNGALGANRDVALSVAIRPGVTSRVVVTIRENPRHRHCLGGTLFAIHGLAHTAASWNPFIDQFFATPAGSRLCRVAAMDLPGHGKSGLPIGTSYESLLVEDYVTAVIETLDALKRQHISATAVLGHSMGGLIVEATQARLLTQGSSLAKRYGIFLAAVMSPAGSREQPWTFADSGFAQQAIGSFIANDPVEGNVVRVDAASWDYFFFTNLAQQFSPGTPAPEDLPGLGYNADEPASAAAELVGAYPFERVPVGAAPFAPRHHTALLYINPSQDMINLRAEAQAGYVQLTGDTSLRGFVPVDDPYGVHDMFIAQPAVLIERIQAAMFSGG